MMIPTMNSVIFLSNLLTNNSNNSNRNNSSSQWTRASLWLASLVCSHTRYMVWLCNRNFCTAPSILLRAPRWRNPNPTYIYRLPRSPQARFLVNMGHLGNQQGHYHHITIFRVRFPHQLILRLRTQNISRYALIWPLRIREETLQWQEKGLLARAAIWKTWQACRLPTINSFIITR